MFEATTYHEKVSAVHNNMLKQFFSTLPDELLTPFMPFYQQALAAEQMLKVGHAEAVLGTCEIDANNRAQLAWVSALMSLNMGRTFFGNKIQGATFEGAIGTKSFGKRWKTWLSELPDLDDSLSPEMITGFYVDQTHGYPVPYFVAVTNDQIIAYCANKRQGTMVAQQLYINHVPANWNWSAGARFEMFPYRADVTRAQIVIELAKAVIEQGVTTLVIPQDGSEAVLEALRAGSYDTTLSIQVFDGEHSIVFVPEGELKALHEADRAEELAADRAEAAAERKAVSLPFDSDDWRYYDHRVFRCVATYEQASDTIEVKRMSNQDVSFRNQPQLMDDAAPASQIVPGQYLQVEQWEDPFENGGHFLITAIRDIASDPRPVEPQATDETEAATTVAVEAVSIDCETPEGLGFKVKRYVNEPILVTYENGDSALVMPFEIDFTRNPSIDTDAGETPERFGGAYRALRFSGVPAAS